MSQMFTACIRRTKDGAFLPYVDVVDLDRRMEWEELHPAGSVDDEAQAQARAQQLASDLRSGDPVPSPGERYRRAHRADVSQAPAASTVGSIECRAMACAGFVAQFNLHEQLLSGDRRRALLAQPA